MRILHLSDLHFAEKTREDQTRVLNELLLDIDKLHGEQPIDVVFFTGDLAFSGAPEEFDAGQELLFDRLLDHLGLGIERLFAVPGNHDVDRTIIDPYLESGLATTLIDRNAVVDLEDEPTSLSRASARLDNWFNFYNQYAGGAGHQEVAPFGRVTTLQLDGRTIGVLALNSSWRASGGEEDRGRLLLGERQVTRAFASIDPADLYLIAVHHPSDWLANFDGDNAQVEFERRPSIVLTGHTHVPDPVSVAGVRGYAVYSRGGCLYESMLYPNGYSVLDVDFDTKKVIVHLRTWFQRRREFDAAVDVAERGRIVLNLPVARKELSRAPVPHSLVVSQLSSLISEESLLAEFTGSSARTPAEILVTPRFLPLPYQEAVAASTVAEDIPSLPALNVLNAIEEGRVILINGDEGAGVTMALYWALARAFESDNERVPIRVTFDPAFKASRFKKALLDQARQSYALTADELPPMLIAIDDVAVRNAGYADALARFIESSPQHRFILGCHGDVYSQLTAALNGRAVKYESAFIGPFGRVQLRRLVQVAVGGNQVNEIVTQVLKIASSNELPRTPLILAALAGVIVKHGDIAAINESGLLNAYAELLTGGDELGTADRLGMDSRRREHLLAWLAELFTRRRTPRLTRLAAESEVSRYFREIGASGSFSPGLVLENLIERRLLVEDWEGVGFRHRAFQSLFAAKRMIDDSEFADFLLSEPVQHRRAVGHAAGLRRTDRDLLRRVGEAVAGTINEFSQEELVDAFNAIKDRPGWSNDAREVEEFKRRLEVMPDPLRDEELDETLDSMADVVEVERSGSEIVDSSEQSGMAALSLALDLISTVVRGSELIEDMGLKVEELRRAIHGWSTFAVLMAVKEDQDHEFADRLDAVLEQMDASEQTLDRVRRLSDLLLVLMALFASEGQLNNVHLSGALETLLDDEQFMDVPIYALFATFLYSQLRHTDWPLRLDALYKRHTDHPVIGELLEGLSVIGYRTDETINERERKQLETLIAEMYVPSTGVKPTTNEANQRARLIRDLRLRRKNRRDGGEVDDNAEAE
jgi:predicted MPP superfamily phosphohydrolase